MCKNRITKILLMTVFLSALQASLLIAGDKYEMKTIFIEEQIHDSIIKYCSRYSVDPKFVIAVIKVESDFNRLGYQFMNQKKYTEAIAVFELNVKMYPDSWNFYDSLGEAYLKADKKDLAMKYYKKAFKLNPQKTEGQKKQYQEQIKILNQLKEGK